VNATIRFRVSKGPKFNESKATICQTLNFHGLDNTGEIAFIAFREEAEKFKDVVQVNILHFKYFLMYYYVEIKVNGTYSLENFNVRAENPKFPSGTGCVHQISINSSSKIIAIDSTDDLPNIPFIFTPLDKLQEKADKSKVGKTARAILF
jgi:hypothetical protein